MTQAPTFDTFWKLYPRKVAKGKARRAWDKQVKAGISPQTIVAGLHRLHAHLMATEPQFRPHPATWLNDERWDDEPAPPSTAPKPYRRRTSVDALHSFLDKLNDQDDGPFQVIEH